MSPFVHLHVASAHSNHHGTNSPEQLVARAASWEAPSAAITDRDGLYGAVRHVRACIAEGIAPIVGVDLALAPQPAAEGAKPAPAGPLPGPLPRATVLAHGRLGGAGWASLSRLVSAAHTPPRGTPATREHQPQLPPGRFAPFLLGEHEVQGTLLLGPNSDVGRALTRGRADVARARLQRWQHLLPGAIAVELVCHLTEPGAPASLSHAAAMLELATDLRLPCVLSNQVRYLDPDDALTGDVLDAAGALRPLDELAAQPNGQAWLKPPTRMHALADLIVSRTGLGGHASSPNAASSTPTKICAGGSRRRPSPRCSAFATSRTSCCGGAARRRSPSGSPTPRARRGVPSTCGCATSSARSKGSATRPTSSRWPTSPS
jgi:error-prone DNA polymerase